MRALNSQLINVCVGHNSLTFKFMLNSQHLNMGNPHMQRKLPEEWGLACWSKLLPQLLVTVVGLSDVSTNQCFMILFHISLLLQFLQCCSTKSATAFNPKGPHFHAEKFQGLLHPDYKSAKQDTCSQN